MDDKLIRLARKVKTLEDELSRLSQIKDLEGLLVASTDMNSRYKKSINETVGMYKEYISSTKKELTDSFEAIKKDYDSKKDSYKKNMNNLEAKINKVKDDIQKVCTSIDKSIEDIQKDILKDIKDKNTQILNEIGKKDKELKEVKQGNASLVKDLKALKDLVNRLELQKGDDGKSAYDIACELGFKGTKEEWIKSLHGKDGQDIELRGLRAFSDVKNDNKMYARKNKKWVEVENYDDTEIREDIAELQEENEAQTEQIEALQTENTRLKATLPTTTGEGENITLSKTAELEFIQPPLPRGNSEQVQYSGKNLFDMATIINGTFTDANAFINENYSETSNTKYRTIRMENFPAGTYTLSVKWNYTARILRIYKDNSITTIGRDGNTYTFTTETTGLLGITFRNTSSTDFNDSDLNIQIEQGTTATDYEPYVGGTASPNPSYPQEITNVTGDVEVLVQNKNWFDKDNIVSGKRLDNSGEATIDEPSYCTTNYFIPVKPNTSYYSSVAISQSRAFCFYDSSKNFISRTMYTGQNVITTTSDTYYMKISILLSEIDTEQLEQGSTASAYTPHKEQTLPLTLGTIELCKIGTAQDYFYKENSKWYLYKAVGKAILDGTINDNVTYIGKYGDGVNVTSMEMKILGIISGSTSLEALSNKYHVLGNGSWTYFYSTAPNVNVGDMCKNARGDGIYIGIPKEYNTIELGKAYLAENPAILYYVLATPTITEITDTVLINQLEAISQALSYEEQTNISGSSDESNPLFSVEAYQSIKLILAS